MNKAGVLEVILEGLNVAFKEANLDYRCDSYPDPALTAEIRALYRLRAAFENLLAEEVTRD